MKEPAVLTGYSVARAAVGGWDGCGFSPWIPLHLLQKELIPGGKCTHRACTASGHPCSAWAVGALRAQELWWAAGAVHRSWTRCPASCRLFPARCVSHIFWTPMGAQKHPLKPTGVGFCSPLGTQNPCLPFSFPPGQVWDERLARAAEAWAARCLWDHGPPQLMKYVGQNLSIHSGR